ncbi:MAG: hypothetical protein E7402_01620 [Ruminococcaceae bacterium]|nr:hypothetical protein [Oscillospiraceae bacterium]
MQDILKTLYGDAVNEDNLATFHEELGKRFVAKADFNHRGEELKSLREQMSAMEAELQHCRDEAKEAISLREALQEERKNMADYIEKESQKQLDAAVCRRLEAAGAKSLPAVRALLNMDGVTLENGTLNGLDEQLWELKKENSYLFDDKETFVQFTSPAATGSSVVSREEFQKMGYMERLKLKREQPELYQKMQTNRR